MVISGMAPSDRARGAKAECGEKRDGNGLENGVKASKMEKGFWL